MRRSDELGRRRDRVRRVNAKRPRAAVDVDLEYSPEPGAREQLVEVLFEMLDKRVTPAKDGRR